MNTRISLKLSLLLLTMGVLVQSAVGQPIGRPFPFKVAVWDTTASSVLPLVESDPIPKTGRLTVDPAGHMIGADGKRLRLFGTELQWTTQFLERDHAERLAKRLRKLGFNAVRLVYNDYPYWADANLLIATDTSSYTPIPSQFAKFDTLLYVLRQHGIYAVLSLANYHVPIAADGIPYPDSVLVGLNHQILYPQAQAKSRAWATTLLRHRNPLTGLTLAEDPAIAIVEVMSTSLYDNNLSWWWQLRRLNYRDAANFYPKGDATISYHQSRRLDTLYAQYLRNRYGNQTALNAAWMGGTVNGTLNLMPNGSFEQLGSTAWTFVSQGGAQGAASLFSPARDSQFCQLVHIAKLGTAKSGGDIALLNLATRLGKDSLYRLSFWAKLRPEPGGPVARAVAAVVQPSDGGNPSLAQAVTIDTNWKAYEYTFRSLLGGLQAIGILAGNELGSFFVDGFKVTAQQETGVYPGESLTANMIVRVPYDAASTIAPNRLRDQARFYDSISSGHFVAMHRYLRDTLKTAALVNYWQGNYGLNLPDVKAMSSADVQAVLTGSDYVSTRPGRTEVDSGWMVRQSSMLKDRSAYPLWLSSSASVEGKAFALLSYTVPHANQAAVENTLTIPAYACFQDWDAIFFSPYATDRADLFNDIFPAKTTFGNIVSNHALLSMMPTASAIFREGLVQTAMDAVTLTHDADDVFMLPAARDYRGFYGVEGYLDGNISTQFMLRQKFNAPTHKIAAEYPYLADTSVTVSNNGELIWDQTNGMFYVNSAKVYAVTGRVGADTIRFPGLKLRRNDNARDILALAQLPLDGRPIRESTKSLLTIATRSQNTGMKWVDSNGYGNMYGTSPAIMSAATMDLTIYSELGSVTVQPLDSLGNPTGTSIAATRNGSSDWYHVVLDPVETKAAWYLVEKSEVLAVQENVSGPIEIAFSANPANTTTTLQLRTNELLSGRIAIVDDLGRKRLFIAEGLLERGEYRIDCTQLPSGVYTVKLTSDKGNRSARLVIVR